ncbi:hypothetical protein FHS56_000552 [Thermonema lapsum]|uniref:Uncharacterized protein n=1 Tax=Thermonema lapsum TaxID=28195 RepID=A0A846MNE5_9BACT|nr:hypothetical protein [Thermonema lapsum]NIK73066.1 hypothetical protein [Thermonema lapsum]
MQSILFSLALSLMVLVCTPMQAQNIRQLIDKACECIDKEVKQYHRVIVQYMYDYVDLGEETAARNLKARYNQLSAQEQKKVEQDIDALRDKFKSVVSSCLGKIKEMNLSDAQIEVIKQELNEKKQCHPLVYYITTNSNSEKEEEDSPPAIDPNQKATDLAESICDCAYKKIDKLHPIVQELLVELIDLDNTDHIINNYKRRYDKLKEQEKEQVSRDLSYVQSSAFKDYIYECLSVVNALDETAYNALLNAIKEEPYCKKMLGAITLVIALHEKE